LLAAKTNAAAKIKFTKKKNFRYYDPLEKLESFKDLCEDESELIKDARMIAIYAINQKDYFR